MDSVSEPESVKSSRWPVYMKSALRIAFVIVNNLYCIPTHCLWLLMLWPLKYVAPKVWYSFEKTGFQWLLSMVSFWSYSAGYRIIEMGDDVSECEEDETLVLVNHQSTSDVPLIMAAFDAHWGRSSNVMWIMDRMFKRTNFGLVSVLHKDFFISSGKEHRETSLLLLRQHISDVYIPLKRKWIILFPEGGFLHKRREISQKFALKNGLPTLQLVTLPRVGAIQTIFDSIGPKAIIPDGNLNSTRDSSRCSLKWVIDLTLAYPKGKPLDLLAVLAGHKPPCQIIFHYRKYPANEVPADPENLTKWTYERYYEKEKLLDTYYSTDKFPNVTATDSALKHVTPVKQDLFRTILLHMFYLSSTYFHVKFLTSCIMWLF